VRRKLRIEGARCIVRHEVEAVAARGDDGVKIEHDYAAEMVDARWPLDAPQGDAP
jgi:hypothetical protein